MFSSFSSIKRLDTRKRNFNFNFKNIKNSSNKRFLLELLLQLYSFSFVILSLVFPILNNVQQKTIKNVDISNWKNARQSWNNEI